MDQAIVVYELQKISCFELTILWEKIFLKEVNLIIYHVLIKN